MKEPTQGLFDMDDYSSALLSKNKTNGDCAGRWIEEETASRCETLLDTCGPVDLPTIGWNIKSGKEDTKQLTICNISKHDLGTLDEKMLSEWLMLRVGKLHYVPRDDQRGLTGKSYNIRIDRSPYAFDRIMSDFLEIVYKAREKMLFIDEVPGNYPRFVCDNKGLWFEYSKKDCTWKLRCSSKYRKSLQMIAQGQESFDTHFDI
jgi:hypothetical protein